MKLLPLNEILEDFKDGDETGWPAEFARLRTEHAKRVAELTVQIARDGIRQPILLGSDGRVWNGHHRLCVADALGVESIPAVNVYEWEEVVGIEAVPE